MDIEDIAVQYGNIETLVDLDTFSQIQAAKVGEMVEEIMVEMDSVSVSKKKRKYKKYSRDQIERFIRVIQEEGLSVPKAAELCGIPRITGYVLLNEFNASDGTVLPGNLPKERKIQPKKLFPEHTAFMIELFDDNPSIILEEVRIELCNNFEGLTIAVSSLYTYIRKSVHYP